MARRLTTNQEIAGSTPALVSLVLLKDRFRKIFFEKDFSGDEFKRQPVKMYVLFA